MSGIAGIYHRDGKPVDPRDLDRMLETISHRGRDARFTFVEGNVALGLNLMITTPEARHERLYRAHDSPYVVVADARIDNRDELIEACGVPHRPANEIPDSALIVAAYDKWGEDCPQYLIGDFAFAIWDRPQRRLFCARDHLGTRPFFYSQLGSSVVFGSETQAPMLDPAFSARPNEGMVGEVLSDHWISHDETLFEDLLRLPSAHILISDAANTTTRRYWQLRSQRLPRQSVAAHSEQLRHLLEEAIHCRMRAVTPVVLSLSGGIDSSTIAVLANNMYHQGQTADQLRYLSRAFPGKPCDESSYIEAVTSSCGSVPMYVEPAPPDKQTFLDQVSQYRYLPDFPNGAFADTLKRAALELGSNVVLTGIGGDDYFSGSQRSCAELLANGKLSGAIDSLLNNTRGASSSRRAGILVRYGFWPLLPVSLRSHVRRVLRRPARRIPNWIHPALVDRARLLERIDPYRTAYSGRHFIEGAVGDAYVAYALELIDRTAHSFGLEQRHPFRDIRVVAFAYSVPPQAHYRNAQTKYLLRQATGDLLPAVLRGRRTKANFSHVFPEAFAAVGGCQCMTLRQREWVDGASIDAAYRCGTENWVLKSHFVNQWPLWSAWGLDALAKFFS